MKRTYLVSIDIDRDTVLTDDQIKDNIMDALESKFDIINTDQWNHKLFTDIKITELNNYKSDKH